MGNLKYIRTLRDKVLYCFAKNSRFAKIPSDIVRHVLMPFVFGICAVIGVDRNYEWIVAIAGAAYAENWLVGRNAIACAPALSGFMLQTDNGRWFYVDFQMSNGVPIGNSYSRYWHFHGSNVLLTNTYDDMFSIYEITRSGKSVSYNICQSFPILPHWNFDPEKDVPFGIYNENLLVYRGSTLRVLGPRPVVELNILQPAFAVLPEGRNRFLVVAPWGEQAWYGIP